MRSNCEKFLRGNMTARRLCQKVGVDDLANILEPVFQDLQDAHNDIVDKRVRDRCRAVVRGYKAGRVLKEQTAKMLGMSEQAVYELLSGEPG